MRVGYLYLLTLLGTGLTAGLVACSSQEDGHTDYEYSTDGEGTYTHTGWATGTATGTGTGYSTGYGGAGSYGTSTGTGYSTGTSTGWGTATGTSGNDPDPLAPPPSDAGIEPDAAFDCTGLDQSQPMVLYLSADDSNSMGSPVWARERINAGMSAKAIRTYEFLNYYRIDYDPAPLGSLNIVPQMQETETAGSFDLQIGVRSYDAPKPRRPMTITFVLDTSGSMGGTSIARERAVVKAVAASLAQGDIVNAVTWSTSNNVKLSGYAVTGPNDPQLLNLANNLTANGGTNLNAGLVAGYQLAQIHYGSDRLNRLLLISDGGANVGVTDENLIAQHSEDADKEGIYLVGVGTGPITSYNDLLMDTVTDEGRGAYVYVDSEQEATTMFTDRFDEVMEVAARAVQVELTLPWYFQMQKFHGEEYSTNPEEVKPQHLAPSDAMVLNQVIRACDPTIVGTHDTVQVKVTWETPLTYQQQEQTISLTMQQLATANKDQLIKGKAIVAYAEALKTGSASDLAAALQAVNDANPYGNDLELNEIATLIPKHPSY